MLAVTKCETDDDRIDAVADDLFSRSPQRRQLAFAFFAQLARHNPRAAFYLGVSYDFGKGVAQSIKSAIKWYTVAAAAGHSVAQYNLSLIYQHGEGVRKDERRALGYLKQAAAQGDVGAIRNLGYFYFHGLGMIRRQYKRGYEFYSQAARRGDLIAMFNRALCKLDGQGTEYDLRGGIRILKQAAERGHSGAKQLLQRLKKEGWQATYCS